MCGDGRRVESVRFLKPPHNAKASDDLRVIAMDCHGERTMITITRTEVEKCVKDEEAARAFIANLCDMSYFKNADKLEVAPTYRPKLKKPKLKQQGVTMAVKVKPTTSAERIEKWKQGSSKPAKKAPKPPKAAESLKRGDAPWNF